MFVVILYAYVLTIWVVEEVNCNVSEIYTKLLYPPPTPPFSLKLDCPPLNIQTNNKYCGRM